MGNVPELHEYIAVSFWKIEKEGELKLQITNEPENERYLYSVLVIRTSYSNLWDKEKALIRQQFKERIANWEKPDKSSFYASEISPSAALNIPFILLLPAYHLQKVDQHKDLFLPSCWKRFLLVNSELSVLKTEITLLLSDKNLSIQIKHPSRNSKNHIHFRMPLLNCKIRMGSIFEVKCFY